MRAATPIRPPLADAHALELRPRPPFRLDLTVWALRRRPQNRVDRWDGRSYRRTLLVDGRPLELTVRQGGRPQAPRLEVLLSGRTSADAEAAARAALSACSASTSISSPSTGAPQPTRCSHRSPNAVADSSRRVSRRCSSAC